MKFIEINKYKKKIKVIRNLKNFRVIGPLGSLDYNFGKLTQVSNENFFLTNDLKTFFLNKIKNLFRGVTTGWFKELKFKGIGYKSFKMNDKIALDVGYSNLIVYKPSSLVKIRNLKNKLVLFSIDREHLNNVAVSIRKYSVPDKYKGKGIWLKNETFKLKKKSKI